MFALIFAIILRLNILEILRLIININIDIDNSILIGGMSYNTILLGWFSKHARLLLVSFKVVFIEQLLSIIIDCFKFLTNRCWIASYL